MTQKKVSKVSHHLGSLLRLISRPVSVNAAWAHTGTGHPWHPGKKRQQKSHWAPGSTKGCSALSRNHQPGHHTQMPQVHKPSLPSSGHHPLSGFQSSLLLPSSLPRTRIPNLLLQGAFKGKNILCSQSKDPALPPTWRRHFVFTVYLDIYFKRGSSAFGCIKPFHSPRGSCLYLLITRRPIQVKEESALKSQVSLPSLGKQRKCWQCLHSYCPPLSQPPLPAVKVTETRERSTESHCKRPSPSPSREQRCTVLLTVTETSQFQSSVLQHSFCPSTHEEDNELHLTDRSKASLWRWRPQTLQRHSRIFEGKKFCSLEGNYNASPLSTPIFPAK